jgi:hypothetical protein
MTNPTAALATPPTTLGKYSASIPFLRRPKFLTGKYAGDVGFDPLGFASSVEQLVYYREAEVKHAQLAEIKHGRLSMIAVTGFAIQEYVSGLGVIDETPAFFKPFSFGWN